MKITEKVRILPPPGGANFNRLNCLRLLENHFDLTHPLSPRKYPPQCG